MHSLTAIHKVWFELEHEDYRVRLTKHTHMCFTSLKCQLDKVTVQLIVD